MRAILIDSEGAAPRLLEDADESMLTGEVALDVEFSSLNYKDAMALAGVTDQIVYLEDGDLIDLKNGKHWIEAAGAERQAVRTRIELADLKERIRNDAPTERRVMRMELAKINRSRLQRMLTPAIEFVDD